MKIDKMTYNTLKVIKLFEDEHLTHFDSTVVTTKILAFSIIKFLQDKPTASMDETLATILEMIKEEVQNLSKKTKMESTNV